MNLLSNMTNEELALLKKKFKISQSFIKQVVDVNDNEKLFCDFQLNEAYITKRQPLPDKEVFQDGKFFESISIESTAHGNELVLDLERKRPNKRQMALGLKGDKKIKQIRIEEQSKNFKELCKQKDIIVNKNNTQVVIYKRWKDVIIRGELDIGFVPIKTKLYGDTISIIDLKLTGNIENKFGEHGWANFEFINKIQAKLYTWLIQDIDLELNDFLNPNNNIRQALQFCGYRLIKKFNPELYETLDFDNLQDEEALLLMDVTRKLISDHKILFIYWVFDHSPSLNNNMFPYPMDKVRYYELDETLRKTVSILRDMQSYVKANGRFRTNVHPDLCNNCWIKNCPEGNKNEIYLF